jgi:hypothetical protein
MCHAKGTDEDDEGSSRERRGCGVEMRMYLCNNVSKGVKNSDRPKRKKRWRE